MKDNNYYCIGSDFSPQSTTLQVPANRESYEVESFLVIIDDNIDEDQQSFVIVAEIGQDVPDGVSCFQITEGAAQCHGRQGATEIRIIDNNRKYKADLHFPCMLCVIHLYSLLGSLALCTQLWSLDSIRELGQCQRVMFQREEICFQLTLMWLL